MLNIMGSISMGCLQGLSKSQTLRRRADELLGDHTLRLSTPLIFRHTYNLMCREERDIDRNEYRTAARHPVWKSYH